MVKHIVFWKFKDEALGGTKEENMRKVQRMLAPLPELIEGLQSAEVGFNFHPAGFDLSLTAVLTDRDALAYYQDFPVHVEVKEFISEVTCDRAVVDYEV